MTEVYCFGRFALDPTECRLYADGVPVPLGATDIRLLMALVENSDCVVPKGDLMTRVWGRAAVTDNALYFHINALRKILGDGCIANKQGRGYRFVAQVQRRRNQPTSRPEKTRTGNLPSLSTNGAAEGLSRLIGRSEQLRVVAKLLAQRRLVTLTGSGGVGKTKFALHAADRSTAHFPDGVWLVELASLKDANLVTGAVAAALGVEIGHAVNPLETLARHLARKVLLIVLDNCEHVVAGAMLLCEALLTTVPGARILATSRESLGCRGEQVLELAPLALPGDDVTQAEIIRGTAAIELFVERATSADAGFRMTDADVLVAARICRQVDGLPLAIEMVAGWAGVLGLPMLEAKLDGTWLRARNTVPPRHCTLHATLKWSHDLLSPAEQTVLCRLAAFAGSFNLEAAEAVASDGKIPKEQLVEHLASLIRKSMVTVVPGSHAQRYRLLETTRAFMVEKLASSEDCRATRQKHTNHMLRVLENAMTEWETTSDAAWQERYWPVIDDLRLALDWAMAVDADDAVAVAGASWLLWRELSLRVEGRQQLSAAAARLVPGTPPELEARLRRGLGALWVNTAAMAAARAELDRAATLYRALGNFAHLGDTLGRLGFVLLVLNHYEEAEQAIGEALKLIEPARYPRMLATAYATQLCIEASLGRFAAARAAGEKALSLCEVVGANRAALTITTNLVEVSLDSGDIDGGIVAGRKLAEQLRDTFHSDVRGSVLGLLVAALTARGDLDEALSTAREAAPLLRDEGSLFWLFDHLALRSRLAGRATDAALLAGYANAVHRKMDHPRWPMGRRAVERLRVLLREALPDDEIAGLEQMGARLSEDQAITLALRA